MIFAALSIVVFGCLLMVWARAIRRRFREHAPRLTTLATITYVAVIVATVSSTFTAGYFFARAAWSVAAGPPGNRLSTLAQSLAHSGHALGIGLVALGLLTLVLGVLTLLSRRYPAPDDNASA